MRVSISQRIIFGFAIALTTLLVVGGVSYRNLLELSEHQRLVVHTVEVLQKNERLFNRLTDSASLARGYALTGDASLRDKFDLVDGEVNGEYEALRTLTQDNVTQQQRLNQLGPYITQRQQAARSVISLRQSNLADSSERIAATVIQGAKIMDEIRRLNIEIETEERRLLQERQVKADVGSRLTTNTLLYGTLFAFLLVGIVSWLVARSIRIPLTALADGATRIGGGDYQHQVAIVAKDELGQLATVFNAMAKQIERRQAALAEQDWLNANLAKFSSLFESQRVQSVVCQSILTELAGVIGARHSLLYVPQTNDGRVVLSLQASYACDKPPTELLPGQGLVGQCFIDRQPVLLRDVPPDYLKINSALGALSPAAILILPAIFAGEVKAIVELALPASPQAVQLTFLSKLSESIGVVLNSIAAVKRTEELLIQARALTERLQDGQREISERNHELQVQAEQLRRKEQLLQEQQVELKQTNEELEQSNEELQQTNAEMEDKQVLLEEQKNAVELANRDVSEARAALEEKVQQLASTSKYKSEFLANMSHELRTPLNSLLILSQVLADNVENTLTPKQVERADAIHSSGKDLLELINDILDLSKIESGSVELQIENFNVADLTDSIDSTMRHMVEAKGLEFAIETDARVPSTLVSDARRVQQVLKNLLANACKFTERGGVTLSISRAIEGWKHANPNLDSTKGVVAFAVTDTGICIPPDRQTIIFEAFQQADAGTARKYGGTGLGLSISRELTRLLGGALTLKSQENVGSVFTLYIPVSISAKSEIESPTASATHETGTFAMRMPPRSLAASQSRIRAAREALHGTLPAAESVGEEDDRDTIQPGNQVLLVVEDDKKFAHILADFAREKGFKVLLAHTAAAGIELAKCFRPTAITLDLLLPDNDGWVVLDRLKHDPETRHIPLHVISVEEQRERSLRLGAVSYLQKPVTAQSIERALSQTIDFVNRPVKNLLIVEDDARQRQSVVELIGNGDVHATAVATAAEALKALEKERYDCLVIDLGLPDMSGAELIDAIQKRHGEASPPIIVYTGKTLTRKEETELRRISDAIIVKDVSSPQRLLAETALFLHRVQAKLPESKRRLLDMIRKDDPLLSNRKVLVVDDDVRNIFAITAALEAHKMQVLHAETGQAGIEALQASPEIDVVLMDIMMPEMDGYEAMRRIRTDERFRKIPIIAVTAKAMKGDRERCLEAGASDYLTKPVDMDQLRSLLRVWLYR